MTAPSTQGRASVLSIVMIVASIGLSVEISLAMDATLFVRSQSTSFVIVLGAVMFNAASILQAVVGSIIDGSAQGTGSDG